jgi:uncharacterized protein (DUF2147 family)
MKIVKTVCSLVLITAISSFSFILKKTPAGEKITGVWLNQEGTAQVQITKTDAGTFFGKIIWLKEPMENGKPKMDKNNPEASQRSTPLLGLTILKNFVYDADDDEWEDGTIYDPKNGKTYSCYITMEGSKLNVRGYIGISLIGRTAVWTRIK